MLAECERMDKEKETAARVSLENEIYSLKSELKQALVVFESEYDKMKKGMDMLFLEFSLDVYVYVYYVRYNSVFTISVCLRLKLFLKQFRWGYAVSSALVVELLFRITFS